MADFFNEADTLYYTAQWSDDNLPYTGRSLAPKVRRWNPIRRGHLESEPFATDPQSKAISSDTSLRQRLESLPSGFVN